MKKRPYEDIMRDVSEATPGKKCRKLHKELKENYKDGLPLFMRYPDLPQIVSVVALIVTIFALILLLLTR